MIRIPPSQLLNAQQRTAVVAGPDGANRLFSLDGPFEVGLYGGQSEIYSVLLGPVLMRRPGAFGIGSTTLTVSNGASYPVAIQTEHAGSLPKGGSYQGNQPDAILLTTGSVVASQLWINPGIPYAVQSGINVSSPASPVLSLERGSKFRMAAGMSVRVGFQGAGALVADGTLARPITFTAEVSAPTPLAGDWICG